jgi:hypothetical protein
LPGRSGQRILPNFVFWRFGTAARISKTDGFCCIEGVESIFCHEQDAYTILKPTKEDRNETIPLDLMSRTSLEIDIGFVRQENCLAIFHDSENSGKRPFKDAGVKT